MIRRSEKSFTIIELIITLVIVSILLGSGYMYMSGILPKQRFNSSASALVNLLLLTQSNAITRGARHGVVIKNKTVGTDVVTFACSFRDVPDPGHQDYVCDDCDCGANDCSCAGEMTGQRWIQLKQDINLFRCSNTPTTSLAPWVIGPIATIMDTIGFNIDGFTYDKSRNFANFSIFLRSAELPVGIRVKEIEVSSGGLIEVVKNGKGNLPGEANVTPCD